MNKAYAVSMILLVLGGALLGCPPTKSAVTSFAINNGNASTDHRTVTLNNVCSETPTQYMASESSAFEGATWQAYATAPTFTLSSGDGPKTVYFKVSNDAGESDAIDDTITLEELLPPVVTAFALKSGETSTFCREVTLDHRCTGGATQYMVAESPTFEGAIWQDCAPGATFTLSPGDGSKTVYFKMRNAAGESTVTSDVITLEEVAPPAVTSFSINGGASMTSVRTVTLNNACTGAPTECVASESPSFAGGTWRPYADALTFELSPGDGSKTVYFRVKNAGGRSAALSAVIIQVLPPTIISFTINGDTALTNSRTVTLANQCTGAPTHYMASESPTFEGASWRNYAPTTSFTLSPGSGPKTVYLKVKDTVDESAALSDTIVLALPPTISAFAVSNGATSTISRTVQLSNACTESPTEYMASELPTFAGALWQPYSAEPTFTLSAGTGAKAVYFKVRNQVSDTAAASDAILLIDPPALKTFSVNGGAGTTTSHAVVLNNTCTNEPAEYLASESPSFTGAEWQPYVAAPAFTLSPGNGPKTVHFKVRNAAGESPALSDAITQTLPPTMASFALNNGASTTIARTVSLNSVCANGPTHYMASESSTFEGAAWQTYSTSPSFTVSEGEGDKAVYFKVKNAYGESAMAVSTIALIVAPLVTAFTVDGGAAATTTGLVTLDNVCRNTPVEYMASESPSFAGAAWQAYAVAPTFRLSPGNGAKSLYFRARNAAGESPAVGDAIARTLPPTVSSFVLRAGARSTITRTVTLDNVCTDDPTHYMASESPSFANASWVTYSPNPTFMLSDGEGDKIVYLRVKNAYGESAASMDAIVLTVPAAVRTFVINTGGAKTTSRVVTLNNICSGPPTHYMASESSAFGSATWQPFSTAPEFTLSAGDGAKTVYLRVKNEAGESTTAIDTITLNEIAIVRDRLRV